MAKIQTRYVCQSCAYESPRWVGKCPNCAEWNTFVEELSEKPSQKHARVRKSAASAVERRAAGASAARTKRKRALRSVGG